jgi:hypothetical protein
LKGRASRNNELENFQCFTPVGTLIDRENQ